jgi:hypothetical protein
MITAHHGHRSFAAVVAALAAAIALGACGSSHAVSTATPGAPATIAVTAAGEPSATTKMICAPEAGRDIATALGTKTIRPVVPTWRASNYSCRYEYRDGSFTLSVQQLPDTAATARYFAAAATTLGRVMKLAGLGQDATTTKGGGVIVRKDNKVLTVDPRQLPARFGTPPDSRANVAITIAATIMGCWTES